MTTTAEDMTSGFATAEEWLRAYAFLALRLNRQATGNTATTLLIYRGPRRWQEHVDGETPPPPASLVEDAEALLDALTDASLFPRERVRYLAAQVCAMRAVAGRFAGADQPLPDYWNQCLDVTAEWTPHEVLDEAHAQLDAALPPGPGTLTERLAAWRAAHSLPPHRLDQLPALVHQAVTETRRRTNALMPLPPDEVVECRLQPGALFLAAGHYEGNLRSTIFINGDLPFNLADLLYVVAHEGHPGHIAESMLKELILVDQQGRLDQQVRFMLGPSFVLSEGLGLHAQDVIFPGEEAQAWLTDNVLSAHDIKPDGSDFAAIHRAPTLSSGPGPTPPPWPRRTAQTTNSAPTCPAGRYSPNPKPRWRCVPSTRPAWTSTRSVTTTAGGS